MWRGILLPRMEAGLGRHAWLLTALLWGVVHLAFGLGNLLVLLPTLILVPLIAQRRHSTWLAVLLHAGLSSPGFVALALGLVQQSHYRIRATRQRVETASAAIH